MIQIYDIGNENYDQNGNAVLTPKNAKIRMAAGGSYDITIEHPIDAEGKWKYIEPGTIVKAPVPKEIIENAFAGYDADVYKTNVKAELREEPVAPTTINYPVWPATTAGSDPGYVGMKTTSNNKNFECLYWDPSSRAAMTDPEYSNWWKEIARSTPGAPVLVTLPAGSDLYFVQDVDSTWYKMSTYYGLTGYIQKNLVTYDRHLTPSELKPRVITEQLFRLQVPTIDNEKKTVTVTGQHVSYDFNGVLTENVAISQASPAMAIGRISENLMIPYRGTIATDMASDENGTYTGETNGKNGMFMLLDPDKGIVSAFDARFTRDNWDLFVLKKKTAVSGYRIRYRKNMRGMTWKKSSAKLVNMIVPVAKDAGGNDLYLPGKWVQSENSYPVPIMERLKVNGQVGKDDGTGTGTNWTEEALLDYMREKAEERFSIDHADEITHEVTVQFEQIGDTAEYSWLKDLEGVLLYDNIPCIDEDTGLDRTLTVTELEWDCIRKKVLGIKLSNITNSKTRTVTGYNVQNNSITPAKLTDDVAGEILRQVQDIIPEYADPSASRPATVTVVDSDPTLSWGNRSKIGSVQGTDLHVTLPANPAPAVVDNLISTSATDALSANMGRKLNRDKASITLFTDWVEITATTSASGNINLSQTTPSFGSTSILTGIYVADQAIDATAILLRTKSGNWYAKIINWDLSPVANRSVTIRVFGK